MLQPLLRPVSEMQCVCFVCRVSGVCSCAVFERFKASWSEFKSWLSEKKQKPESVLSQVQQQKSQHTQQVVDGMSHLWSEAVRWSEAGLELREQAAHVFQLHVRFGGSVCASLVDTRPMVTTSA